MAGLFMIDRDLLHHHIVGMQNKDRFCMWIWILSAASWKSRKIFVQGKEITLARGQLFVSIRTFAAENHVSKGVAERFIRDLKSGTMIETVNETGGTIITVCNYSKYQDFKEYRQDSNGTANKTATGQQRDSNGTATGHKRTPDETPDEIPEKSTILSEWTPAASNDGIWKKGLEDLNYLGMSDRAARSTLGKWCKTVSQNEILSAISEARRVGAVDAPAYIEKIIRPNESDTEARIRRIKEKML